MLEELVNCQNIGSNLVYKLSTKKLSNIISIFENNDGNLSETRHKMHSFVF